MEISNFEIERIFKMVDNNELEQNFVGVFLSNKMDKFFNKTRMMKGKKYPFLIANTDRSDKADTDWWSILDIDGKKDFLLFHSFGVKGLKNFILQDDEPIVKKILKGVENIGQDISEINLLNVNFSADSCYLKLSDGEKLSLSETANDLFHFIGAFAKFEGQSLIHLWLLEDPIQDITTNTCGPFQTYFYDNLFLPDNDNKIHEYKKLAKDAVQDLLNELFLVYMEKNEENIEQFIRQKGRVIKCS